MLDMGWGSAWDWGYGTIGIATTSDVCRPSYAADQTDAQWKLIDAILSAPNVDGRHEKRPAWQEAVQTGHNPRQHPSRLPYLRSSADEGHTAGSAPGA